MSCFQAGARLTLVLIFSAVSLAQQPAIDVVPGDLKWQNAPVSWQVEHGNQLTIRSGKETDWFVDPFDGAMHNTAPMLLFVPANDYVFNAKVKVGFNAKWDAGALMIWADEHHWAKLSSNSPRRNSQPWSLSLHVGYRTIAILCPSRGTQSICKLPRAAQRMFSISLPMPRTGRCCEFSAWVKA
jgi:hypothetical protein